MLAFWVSIVLVIAMLAMIVRPQPLELEAPIKRSGRNEEAMMRNGVIKLGRQGLAGRDACGPDGDPLVCKPQQTVCKQS